MTVSGSRKQQQAAQLVCQPDGQPASQPASTGRGSAGQAQLRVAFGIPHCRACTCNGPSNTTSQYRRIVFQYRPATSGHGCPRARGAGVSDEAGAEGVLRRGFREGELASQSARPASQPASQLASQLASQSPSQPASQSASHSPIPHCVLPH